MPAWTVLPFALIAAAACPLWADPPGHAQWELVFEDQFDGTDADLERNWKFRNGPSDHILCSRWRENAVLDNGILKLVAKKETRAGQDWTAASLWTKQRFQYGYFECRYRYAPTTGTNNSFWIITLEPRSKDGSTPNLFEIDINEGHYPDEVNMNLHNRSGKHWSKGGRWYANDGPRDEMARAEEPKVNLGKTFHVYGLEWTETDLIYYFDGQEIRRQPHTICHRPAPVWLSLAITDWAGTVTDDIDGKSMDVDYVRVYRKKPGAMPTTATDSR